MQLAKRQTVGDYRLTIRLRIRHDVRSVEQLFVSQLAECTLLMVRIDHSLAKRLLMDPAADDCRNVTPSDVGDDV
jgi:hypothetical protein